jgi:hypothetical protein
MRTAQEDSMIALVCDDRVTVVQQQIHELRRKADTIHRVRAARAARQLRRN